MNEKFEFLWLDYFPFTTFRTIVFPEVQLQDDSYNCGPMVIATSILFDINPCIVTYDQSLTSMSAMFARQIITHFPYFYNSIASLTLLPLKTLKRRESDALRKRFAHSKETEEAFETNEKRCFFSQKKICYEFRKKTSEGARSIRKKS